MSDLIKGAPLKLEPEDFVKTIRWVTYDVSELVLWKKLRIKPKTLTKDESNLWDLLYEK